MARRTEVRTAGVAPAYDARRWSIQWGLSVGLPNLVDRRRSRSVSADAAWLDAPFRMTKRTSLPGPRFLMAVGIRW
jgi:hypothetical protein